MKKINKTFLFAAGFFFGIASSSVAAVDGMSIQGGAGAGSSSGNGTRMARVAIQWDWDQRWLQSESWHLGGFWDVGVGYWRRDALPDQNDDVFAIGVTPVFRLQQNDLQGPYVEAGVGAYLLSHTSLGDKRYSTLFQFGSHLGVGYRFGVRQAFDLSASYQHISNSDIKKPNDGADFYQLRLQYHF